MPNINNLLREEIARVSRREMRKQMAVLQRSSAAYRRDIAALKRQVAQLSRDAARANRAKPATIAPEPDSSVRHRFVASGFRTLRHRLGLSASQMGKLLGVSEQSIYNWETKVATPRRAMLPRIAELRGKGKREVMAVISRK